MGRLKTEINALLRKNITYQKKSWGMNCCILLTPVVICVMLKLIQSALENAIGSNRENQCGCLCRVCELNDDTVSGIGSDSGEPCPLKMDQYKQCKEYDEDECGWKYSTIDQYLWCGVLEPGVLPPLIQIPTKKYRADAAYLSQTFGDAELPEDIPEQAVTVLYTGEDAGTADLLMQNVFRPINSSEGSSGLDDSRKQQHFQMAINLLEESIATGVFRGDFAGYLDITLGGSAGIEFSAYADPVLAGLSTFNEDNDQDQGASFVQHNPSPPCTKNQTLLETILTQYAQYIPDVITPEKTPYLSALFTASDGNAAGGQDGLDLAGLSGGKYVEENLGDQSGGCAEGDQSVQCLLKGLIDEGKWLGLQQVVGALEAVCAESIQIQLSSQSTIDNGLYCGFLDARCTNSAEEINEITAAFNWNTTSTSKLDASIQYNDTNDLGIGGGFDGPPNYQRSASLVHQVIYSFAKFATGKDGVEVKLLGLQEFPSGERDLELDFSSFIGTTFFQWMFQLLFPVMMVQLIYEKESHLRLMMRLHGVGEVVYWGTAFLYYFVLHVLYVIVTLIIGSAVGLNFFTKNSYALQVVFYVLFSNAQIASAFFLSTLFSSSATAQVFANLWVFGSGVLSSFILDIFISRNRWFVPLLDLVPSFGLYHGLYEFSDYSFVSSYTDGDGLTFSKARDGDNGIWYVMIIFVIESLVLYLLTWYLNQVTDQGTGMKKHPLFFLRSLSGSRHAPLPPPIQLDDLPADVAEEHARVEQLASSGQHPAILLQGLQKVFPGQGGMGQKVAVKDLTLGVESGECFGLLGPNGAGKSTSINMMTGFHQPSRGSAYVCGLDLRTDINAIYRLMGVCPQHDLLWGKLTAREHLLFYGRLKELKGQDLKAAVEAALKSVNLYAAGVGDKQVQTFSGGMKRRLSVAISLIGNPQVVYMDEPSTGLDPASRRALWQVVQTAKRDRAIILTTHSMEEASILCDRLGIFVSGKLACIGSPTNLTSAHGGYLVFSIMVPERQVTIAKNKVAEMCPEAKLTYEIGGTLRFELPCESVTLGDVFGYMDKVQGLEVLDWGVHNANLEEVFIKFAGQSGELGAGQLEGAKKGKKRS